MSDYLRIIGGGAIIGLIAAGMLAIPSVLPPAIADDEPAKTLLSTMDTLGWRFDTDDLVKYDFTLEPGVSTDVVKTRTVRKIGYGRTEFVEILTTPSGTYSSDGLASPYIRYPGIHKELKAAPLGRIALWTGDGWKAIREIDAGSFVSVVPFEGGQLVTSDDGNCVFIGTAAYC